MAIYHLSIKIISRGKGKSISPFLSKTRHRTNTYHSFRISATQIEKKGIATDIGNVNREIKHQNMILREISGRIKALLNWIRRIGKEEKAETENTKFTIPHKENLISVFENLIRKNADNHNADLEQFLSNKFDITKHKNYKLLEDYDKKIVVGEYKDFYILMDIKEIKKVKLENDEEVYKLVFRKYYYELKQKDKNKIVYANFKQVEGQE